ncbi:MAG: SNF1-interacting protein [Candelina mexicana]|nr:MAG: SNF1-interacting protein [Candelina mexicana]
MLFPNVRRDERLVMVFRATWNPDEQQEFPGRVYVTEKELYFYSHHFGLVLVSDRSLATITEVTAAPGRDCDFLYLHLNDSTTKSTFNRLTIKTFLEPLRLLQRRLNFLVLNCNSESPLALEAIITKLMKMEQDDPTSSPSLESWEDVSLSTPTDDGSALGRSKSQRQSKDLRATVLIDQGLHGPLSRFGEGKDITKFRLPAKPVEYVPQGMGRVVVEKQFEISPKALFHVMFGDKSAVFQMLHHQRHAQCELPQSQHQHRSAETLWPITYSFTVVKQRAWTQADQGHLKRDFDYQIQTASLLRGTRPKTITDHQTIDVLNDHLCYVVTDRKTPWHLPHEADFILLTKIVITHVAKSKCKMAIYAKVDWRKSPTFAKGIVEKQALEDLDLDALDLLDAVTDQVQRLGAKSRTKKAIQIFGQVGQQKHESHFPVGEASNLPMKSRRRAIRPRSLLHLLLESVGSFAESSVSSVMMWMFAFLKRIWQFTNAYYIVLTLLAFSVVMNMFYSSREISDWWNDRRTGVFMTRLGVGPNPLMSKAIYLDDINNAMENYLELSDNSRNRCYSNFREMASLTDLNSPYQSAGSTFSDLSTKATARRLLRTRQHLGTYRHDLLVAMRVVNNVEREMVRAEWENWLLDENLKCDQLGRYININRTSVPSKGKPKWPDAQTLLGAKGRSRLEDVRLWYNDYCASCRRERASLNAGKQTLAFH